MAPRPLIPADPDFVDITDAPSLAYSLRPHVFTCSVTAFWRDYGPPSTNPTNTDTTDPTAANIGLTKDAIELCIAHLLRGANPPLRATSAYFEWTAFPALTASHPAPPPFVVHRARRHRACKGQAAVPPRPVVVRPSQSTLDPQDTFAPVFALIDAVFTYTTRLARGVSPSSSLTASSMSASTSARLSLEYQIRRCTTPRPLHYVNARYAHVAQGCVAEAEWDADLARNMSSNPTLEGAPDAVSDEEEEADAGKPKVKRDPYAYAPRATSPSTRAVVPIFCAAKRIPGDDGDGVPQQSSLQDRLQLECCHIMRVDPRRMWMYAVSIEDDRARIWLFTRTHIVKTEAFNWVRDIHEFVQLWMTLASATPAELGIDPLVHRRPGGHTYVYEVDPSQAIISPTPTTTPVSTTPPGSPTSPVATSTSTSAPRPVFFQILAPITTPRLACITDRTTRVWSARAVDSLDDPTPLTPHAPPVALKDVWQNATMPPEAANQARLFAAIDAFAADPRWRADARLRQFSPEIMAELAGLFEGKAYRRLFLTRLHAWVGGVSKTLSGAARAPVVYGADGAEEEFVVPPLLSATYRQVRSVYAEVCQTVLELETLGEVMGVLGQTLTALRVMFCAGWVHRDISPGNILAYRTCDRREWGVRLADLEYAKPYDGIDFMSSLSGGKLGTTRFLPTEIYMQEYLLQGLRNPIERRIQRITQRTVKVKVSKDGKHRLVQKTLATQLNATGAAALALNRFNTMDPAILFFNEADSDVDSDGDTENGDEAPEAEATVAEAPAKKPEVAAAVVDTPPKVSIPTDADFTKVPAWGASVVHNFQHDLESLWWVALYFIAMRIPHKPSRAHCGVLFNNWDDIPVQRADVLRPLWRVADWHLHPTLRAVFYDFMMPLRWQMVKDYHRRAAFGQMGVPGAYADVHALFADQFKDLLLKEDDGKWWEMTFGRSL